MAGQGEAGPPPLALVTGGHRRLGARIAMHLARNGYALAIHGRHDAVPHRFLTECLAETGADWQGFVADFLSPAPPRACFPQSSPISAARPDLLVNSASLFGEGSLESVTAQELADYHRVNTAAR